MNDKRKNFGCEKRSFPNPCKPDRAGKFQYFLISQIMKNAFVNTTQPMSHAMKQRSALLIVNVWITIARSGAVEEDAKVLNNAFFGIIITQPMESNVKKKMNVKEIEIQSTAVMESVPLSNVKKK